MEKDRELFAQALEEAFIRKFDAELAEPVIDVQTGTELTPGDPENCAGNGKEDPMTCCCDGCDYLASCYPQEATEAP